jgi:DNA polymerase-1
MAQQEDMVYLVDGSSYIHRAYHAIRNLSNSKGLPTNAVFGFSKMILKLMKEEKPRYLAVVLDAKGPTFRHAISEQYKATRPPMAEELQTQLPYIKAVLDGLNLKVLEKQGFEADDLIGTLARIAEEEDFRVTVVSGDKDFRQIITRRTSLWDTMKDRHTDYDTFTEEVGVKPEQMVDVMALSGDVSDNIPGVKGIGEKTAITLVKQFGSLEEVFDRLDQVKKDRLRESLRQCRDDAMLSKRLVTIDRFVPLIEKATDLQVGVPDPHKLAEIFRELEFRDLRDQFFQPEDPDEKAYRLVLSGEELTALTRRIKENGLVGIALKTTGEDLLLSDLAGIAFSCEGDLGWYLPFAHACPETSLQPFEEKALGPLKDVMEDETIHKVSPRLKQDSLVLRRRGIELKGLHFDTTVASYVINPGLRQHDLSSLAHQFLNRKTMDHEGLVGKKVHHFGEVEVRKAMAYACEEAEVALRLRDVMDEELASEKNRSLFYDLEMRLIPVLVDMEWTGIKVDIEFFKELSRRFSENMSSMEKEIHEEAGMDFNVNSPQQLGYVLFEKLGLPAQKKTSKTRAYSTDVKVLTKLAALPYKIPSLLLRYRTLSKLKSTYLDSLVGMVHPDTGRIHTSFNQTVAATGRLSSSNPNLQNIPSRGEEGREIRKGFVAEKRHLLVSADYSQVELRVFAHYSKDSGFLEAFKREEDIHARTASELLGVPLHAVTPDMRRIAKAINFGIIYGMGPQKLSEELGIDFTLAKNYIATYYHRYPGVTKYREETIESARQHGYVSTLFRRRRYLPDINHKNRIIRGEAERMAVNTPIQGTAADLIKKAMIGIHGRLKKESLETKMLLQVHDELLFEVPENEVERVASMVKEEMEGVYALEVPLKVDVKAGYNWDEAH